jgi:hypothetical protein
MKNYLQSLMVVQVCNNIDLPINPFRSTLKPDSGLDYVRRKTTKTGVMNMQKITKERNTITRSRLKNLQGGHYPENEFHYPTKIDNNTLRCTPKTKKQARNELTFGPGGGDNSPDFMFPINDFYQVQDGLR